MIGEKPRQRTLKNAKGVDCPVETAGFSVIYVMDGFISNALTFLSTSRNWLKRSGFVTFALGTKKLQLVPNAPSTGAYCPPTM